MNSIKSQNRTNKLDLKINKNKPLFQILYIFGRNSKHNVEVVETKINEVIITNENVASS